MIEVKITYFPPCAHQGVEGPLTTSRNISIVQLRAEDSDERLVSDTALFLYKIILANSETLQGELE